MQAHTLQTFTFQPIILQISNTFPTVGTTNYFKPGLNFFSVITTNTSNIKNTIINNGGTNVYVCNKNLTHFYTKFKNSNGDELITITNRKIKIDHCKIMKTTFENSDRNFCPVNFFITWFMQVNLLPM